MWMSKHSPIEIGFPSINGQVTGQSVFCIFYRLQNLARVFCKIIRACFPANKIVPVAYVAPLSERFPASPRGGRQPARFSQAITSIFLSTSPARGTTANVTENTLYFPVTFVTTRYSVQKHAAFLCRMRLFPQRIRTNTLKMITDSRCEPSGVFLRATGSHPRLATRGRRFCADAFTPAKYRPAPIAARGRRVRPWPCTGCRAGKNAGCPHPGR